MPQSHETLRTLWISGFHRRRAWKNLLLPLKLIVSALQSLWLLITFKPQLVIGTGGYVMGPVLFLAQKLGIPTLLQEQNSFPGLTTRRLAARAKAVCLGFEAARDRLPKASTHVTGNPLRSSFSQCDRQLARTKWALDGERKTVLVFGGSLGAQSINEAVAIALPKLLSSANVIWQTGKSGIPNSINQVTLAQATQERHLVVLPFIDNMSEAYAAADLAVCRAGAMTIAELAVTGLPAVFVPYPYATDDHQTANAKSLVDKGAAMLINDRDMTPTRILDTVTQCLASEPTLAQMSIAMKSFSRPRAADDTADLALSLLS
jgi:UDP-N-acetylglucosamine--N-acetylmuramyl-(pentapeptide) pyrophosphoryl-undecaprenol N-acetylglucosamine transferase